MSRGTRRGTPARRGVLSCMERGSGGDRFWHHGLAREVTPIECERGGRMSGPFIFIATNRLKPGAYEAERHRVPGLVKFIEAGEPRLLAFNEYINADRTEVTVVQVHPDAASMEFHMGVLGERAAQAYAETLDATTAIQVFGAPSDAVVETLRAQAGRGVPLTVHAEHLGGFTRIRA